MSNNELNTNPLVSAEERMVTLAIKTAAIVATITILGMVSCSMHSNAYEADVVAEEAKLQIEKTKAREAEAKVEIEHINAMERMVNSGVNPVALRCMDKGWERDNDVCLAVGVSANKNQEGEF